MAYQMVAQIGYEYFTGSEEDMVWLLAIASRIKKVERTGYGGSYYLVPPGRPIVSAISMEEVSTAGPPVVAADIPHSQPEEPPQEIPF